ncbi:hypothetical protein FHY55_04135 [Oceanicola sp. D3]|uniref:hypothetical protein n=1 Tax=Oceanicola sp. D3 TaxID=2587163 RepID=UPI0011216DDC|nr:hypothetical protein [Oceanicola sp. D3]QDC08482.1 hypothetical protein FHY55_04135 [Oceanicola sp. D3]
MAEEPTTEFWRDLKPIANIFRPDAKPEAYLPDAAAAGDFIFESLGERHTLVAYEHDEPINVFFQVHGPLIWLDEAGEPDGFFDVRNDIELCHAHNEKVGLGADYVDSLFR